MYYLCSSNDNVDPNLLPVLLRLTNDCELDKGVVCFEIADCGTVDFIASSSLVGCVFVSSACFSLRIIGFNLDLPKIWMDIV